MKTRKRICHTIEFALELMCKLSGGRGGVLNYLWRTSILTQVFSPFFHPLVFAICTKIPDLCRRKKVGGRLHVRGKKTQEPSFFLFVGHDFSS